MGLRREGLLELYLSRLGIVPTPYVFFFFLFFFVFFVVTFVVGVALIPFVVLRRGLPRVVCGV